MEIKPYNSPATVEGIRIHLMHNDALLALFDEIVSTLRETSKELTTLKSRTIPLEPMVDNNTGTGHRPITELLTMMRDFGSYTQGIVLNEAIDFIKANSQKAQHVP